MQNSWIWAEWNSRGPLKFEWIFASFFFPRLSFPRKTKYSKRVAQKISFSSWWSMSDVFEWTQISTEIIKYINSFLFNFNFSFWCCNECCHIKKTLYIHIFSTYLWVTDFVGLKMLKFSNKQYFSAFSVSLVCYFAFMVKNYKMVISLKLTEKKTTPCRVEIYHRRIFSW